MTLRNTLMAVFGIAGFLVMPAGQTFRGLAAGILLALAGAVIQRGYSE